MFARTTNLLLRPAWGEDGALLTGMIASELSFGDLVAVPKPSQFLADEDGLPKMLVFLRTNDAPVLAGTIGLMRSGSDVELAVWIAPRHRGRGYGTEAASAMVALATQSLRRTRLVARHRKGDEASARLFAALGFRASASPAGAFLTLERRQPCRIHVARPLLARAA